MMEHEMGLQEVHYNNMLKGIKVYEGRLNDEKRQKINIGDIIKVLKDPLREESFYVKIKNKYLFKSFKEMSEKLDIYKLGFVKETKEEVVNIYHEFYNQDKEDKYGVVVFEVELI